MPTFQDFTEHDFVELAGTSWRNRGALGGVLAALLRPDLAHNTQSWGVRRRLELHIARRSHYDFDDPFPYAKLFVYTTGDLAYGFYVEGTGKRSDDTKYHDWRNFRELLRTDDRFRQALSAAIVEHDLLIADYYRRNSDGGALGGQFQSTNGRLQWCPAGQGDWEDSTFDEFIERVTSLNGERWIDLHIFARMDRTTAVAMGQKVLEPLVSVLGALVPVYQAVIAPCG